MKDGTLIKNKFGTFKVVHVPIRDVCKGCFASEHQDACMVLPDCSCKSKKGNTIESWIYVKVEDKTNG